jgi:hypothetical protein
MRMHTLGDLQRRPLPQRLKILASSCAVLQPVPVVAIAIANGAIATSQQPITFNLAMAPPWVETRAARIREICSTP